MFEGVTRLTRGCYTAVQHPRAITENWWEPIPWQEGPRASEREQYEEYRDALQLAVRDSFINVANPYIALSGGLDSTTLALVASDLSSRGDIPAPRTVTLGFAGYPDCDERGNAEEVARALGLAPQFADVEPFSEIIRGLAKADHPLTLLWGAVTFSWARSLLAHGGDRVAIGTLGDFLGGMSSRWASGLSPDRVVQIPENHASRALRVRMRDIRKLAAIYLGSRGSYAKTLIERCQRGGFAQVTRDQLAWRIGKVDQWMAVGPFGCRAEQAHMLMLADDLEAALSACELLGLDAARPFLDRRVIEASLRLGPSWRWRHGLGRWILREMGRDRMPTSVRLTGRKINFNTFYRDYWDFAIDLNSTRSAGLRQDAKSKVGPLANSSLGAISVLTELWLRDLGGSGKYA